MRAFLKVAGLVLATLLSQGCLVDPDLKAPYAGYEPEPIGDGWEVSSAEAAGLDPSALDYVFERLFSEDAYPTVRSLLVVRHGRLVAEGYSRDRGDRDAPHLVQSVTKSVTSLLMGIALEEGLLDLDTPLYDLMPEHFDADTRKRILTLRHVLTMTDGLEFHNEEDSGAFMYVPGSSVRHVLSRPLVAEPGSRFYYHDGNPQLAAGALRAAGGWTLEDYAKERLFGPMGIRDYRWEAHADGLSFGAYGLWLRPRDMARIGQLMLQGGTWEGRRLVSADWIEASTRIYQNGDYGFYWWIVEEGAVYRAAGAGGQIIFVHEQLDLVVVLTGDAGSKSWVLSPGIGELIDGVLQAVVR